MKDVVIADIVVPFRASILQCAAGCGSVSAVTFKDGLANSIELDQIIKRAHMVGMVANGREWVCLDCAEDEWTEAQHDHAQYVRHQALRIEVVDRSAAK